jgi:hypothetical protein
MSMRFDPDNYGGGFDVAEVQHRATEFAVNAPRVDRPGRVGPPLLLILFLVVFGLAVLLLLARAVGWRTDVAVLLVTCSAGVGYLLRGPR